MKEIGLNLGHRCVGSLMGKNDTSVVRTRKHNATPVSGHKLNISPNLLDRDFSADAPNLKWAGDIGYAWTGEEGVLGCDPRLALSARDRLGSEQSHEAGLGGLGIGHGRALRQPPKGCIHHKDHGSQYCTHDDQKRLSKHGFKVYMSGKGNCYDHAAVETFFKTIKTELICRRSWDINSLL